MSSFSLSPHSLLSSLLMKFLVALSLLAAGQAAPLPEADPQLVQVVGQHPLTTYAHHAVAAPAVATYAHHAAPAVAVAQPHVTYAHHAVAAPVVAAYAHHAAPAVTVAQPVTYTQHAVATAPVVHTAPVLKHVGYKVHHQVHHVPQVSVQKHVTQHTTHHVINHAPVVGAISATHLAAPVQAVAAAPAPVSDEGVISA